MTPISKLRLVSSIRDHMRSRARAEDAPTVVFIYGAGHCGSTLLNLVLNGHSHMIGTSELDTLPRAHANGWSTPAAAAFWQAVDERVQAATGRSPLLEPDAFTVPSLQEFARLWPQGIEDRVAVSDAVLDAIVAESGKPVVVDASKRLARALVLGLSHRYRLKVIHLVRDGKGVLNSYRRKGYSLPSATVRWANSLAGGLSLYNLFGPQNVLLMLYEEFTADPAGAGARILDFIGLPHEPCWETFGTVPHVSVGGNRMQHGPLGAIEPRPVSDQHLSPLDKAAYQALGGAFQRAIIQAARRRERRPA